MKLNKKLNKFQNDINDNKIVERNKVLQQEHGKYKINMIKKQE